MKSLKPGGKGFEYKPHAIQAEDVTPIDPLPDEMVTSIYLQSSNTDFRVVIIPPCVEYHISAKNFTFIKQLSRVENSNFISAEFEGWTDKSIACLTSVKQFRNLFEANQETSFITNYYYSEATGMATDF